MSFETQSENERKRDEASDIILTGHVWKAVWFLAWPTAINTLLQTAYMLINMAFVGRMKDATPNLAAVGIGNTALMIQFAILIGLSAGTAALVARFLGARQYEDADEATKQSLILSVIGGVITGVPLIIFARQIVIMIGASGPVIALAADYTAVIAWYSIPMFIFMIATTALRSAGDVRSPLYAGAISLALNAILDYILIFGAGPIPALGIHGAAISTGITRIPGMLLALWFLRRSILRKSLDKIVPHNGWFGRILKIGWPAMIQNILWTTAYAGFMKILEFLPYGQAIPAQAALRVGVGIESAAFMPGVAYSVAATPLVGQNLGAGQPERAANTAWVATAQAVAIMSFVAALFITIPYTLARIFTPDMAVVPLVVTYLQINAIAEPFLAINMVLRGALQGAGETRVPMWIMLFTQWILRLPLTWLLSITMGYGVVGAWISMASTQVLSGILIAIAFKWGRWREIEI